MVAGFRLDGFSAIKPRVTHSPPPQQVNPWDVSSCVLEDRFISPAVLYIQVSAFQVRRQTNILSTDSFRCQQTVGHPSCELIPWLILKSYRFFIRF